MYLHLIKDSKENENNKIIFKHPDEITYVDTKGRSRLISNDEIVFYTFKNGEYVLTNASGCIYKNFSKEKKEKELYKIKEKNLKNKESTYCIDNNNHKKDWICKGKRFKDFITGDIYVIRYINYKYYYLNTVDGTIVRKTDWQKEQDKKNIKSYLQNDLNIEEFNKQQLNIQDKQKLFRNYEYNFYCDYYK